VKVDLDITASMLHSLYEKIRTEGEMPNDWKCGLLVKLPKKGDTTNCDNWQGITLFSVPSKVLTSVPLNRIKEHVKIRTPKGTSRFSVLVWFGLFVHPFSHICNIGHVNYKLQFTAHLVIY
jgi:hypothetical protein